MEKIVMGAAKKTNCVSDTGFTSQRRRSLRQHAIAAAEPVA